MIAVTLSVNQKAAEVTCHPDDTLLHVLRNHLDLKGTRFGCGLEQCGSCTVLVDGEPVHACTLLAQDATGKSVTTIEGLSVGAGDDQDSGDALDPLQQAFLDEQAGQCGYCLSGMIMAARALLNKNPSPSRADIVAALDNNLCRCGAQLRIVRAVERAAAGGAK